MEHKDWDDMKPLARKDLGDGRYAELWPMTFGHVRLMVMHDSDPYGVLDGW